MIIAFVYSTCLHKCDLLTILTLLHRFFKILLLWLLTNAQLSAVYTYEYRVERENHSSAEDNPLRRQTTRNFQFFYLFGGLLAVHECMHLKER